MSNSYGKKLNASARLLLPKAMLERWLQVRRQQITFGLLTTNCFVSTKKIWWNAFCTEFHLASAMVRELPYPTLWRKHSHECSIVVISCSKHRSETTCVFKKSPWRGERSTCWPCDCASQTGIIQCVLPIHERDNLHSPFLARWRFGGKKTLADASPLLDLAAK